MVISVIVEGGLVRGIYRDGVLLDKWETWDFDIFDGGDPGEITGLRADIQQSDPDSDLGQDLRSYLH